MRLWQAIKALEDGEKIRKGTWPVDVYLQLVPDDWDKKPTLKVFGTRIKYAEKAYNFKFYLGDDWETI